MPQNRPVAGVDGRDVDDLLLLLLLAHLPAPAGGGGRAVELVGPVAASVEPVADGVVLDAAAVAAPKLLGGAVAAATDRLVAPVVAVAEPVAEVRLGDALAVAAAVLRRLAVFLLGCCEFINTRISHI